MTDPLTDADLDAIAERINCPSAVQAVQIGEYEACARAIVEHDAPYLFAEVRRLRAMEQLVREYARHLARPFADGVPDREGEQIASEVLAVLDGGE